MAIRDWKGAYNKCQKVMHDRLRREVVRKSELEKIYSSLNQVSVKTAKRRMKDLIDANLAKIIKEGRNAFIMLEV